jgi:trk system potassium uptake protein TrkH
MLFSVNFNVYYLLLLRNFRNALRNEELWVYTGTFLTSSLIIAVNTFSSFDGFGSAFHHSAFTVASVMSTTGYVTADYELWPQLSRSLLLLLMFMGASAGSTGGGLKAVRIIILLKSARRCIRQSLHPRAVGRVHVDGQALEDSTVNEVNTFTVIYFLLMAGFTLVLSLDGLDFETTFSSVVSCMNNIGPAMKLAGPTLNYSCFSGFGKLLLSFSMLFGRLELYPMLMLFVPSAWRK